MFISPVEKVKYWHRKQSKQHNGNAKERNVEQGSKVQRDSSSDTPRTYIKRRFILHI